MTKQREAVDNNSYNDEDGWYTMDFIYFWPCYKYFIESFICVWSMFWSIFRFSCDLDTLGIMSYLRCKTPHMRQRFIYGCIRSHGDIELICGHKIELRFSFTLPPVWDQWASYFKSYAHFTREWYVCLARWLCWRYEGVSIDTNPLVSNDIDARRLAESILWTT